MTASSETNLGNESSAKLPVPKCMRTDRRTPRIIASCIVVVWLVVLYLGTTALARQQTALRTPLDSLLEVGTHHWVLNLSAGPASCVGALVTDFNTEKNPKLTLNGKFAFKIEGRDLTTSISSQALFTEFRKLQTIDAKVQLPTGEASLKTNPDSKSMTARFSNTQLTRENVFPQPEPIFLTERGSQKYSLVLPEELQQLSEKMKSPAGSFNDSLGVSFLQVSEAEYQNCFNSLQSVNHNAIDLSSALAFFKAGSLLNSLGK